MNCYFCNNEMKSYPIEWASDTVPSFLEFHCKYCVAYYSYSCEMDVVENYYFTQGQWGCYFFPLINKFNLIKFTPLASDGRSTNLVVKLDHIPSITPTSLRDKLPTLLVFS